MTFPLFVYSIHQRVFEGEASSVSLPSQQGQIQVLAQHVPLVSLLKEGTLSIQSPQGKEDIPIAGGVLEVRPDKVVVLANF